MDQDTDGEKTVRLSQEMFAALAPIAMSLGVDFGIQGDGKIGKPTAPVVDIRKDILPLVMDVAQIVRNEGLYLLAGRVVTIEQDGTVEPMTDKAFISWLPEHCVVCNGRDEDTNKPKRTSMSAKRASEILESRRFKAMLPEVTRILPSHLPVFSEDGKKVRLLAKGYDHEHKVFVTSNAPKIEEWEIERAQKYLRELLASFPWGDDGRSLAAQISAMVGNFVQMFFPDALAVPLYYYNANLEGSGKSILAEMSITPIYGSCVTDDFGDGDEFLKVLASKAEAYASYLFLDDVEGFIKSQTLNRWIVQPQWGFRRMHSHRLVTFSKRCMTLITANRATLSDDLVRRMVLVDLFATGPASERMNDRKGVEVTAEWLSQASNRTDILSALWSMVRHWAHSQMPDAPRKIASFVKWSGIVGGIVATAGFGDPFAPAQLADAGDKWQTEWISLFSSIVRTAKPDAIGLSIALPEWCAKARELGLYVDKLGDLEITLAYLEENPRLWKSPEVGFLTDEMKRYQAARYMHPQKQASPFAKILRKRGGQVFTIDGRRYRFADRHTSTSTFVVRDVTDEKGEK